MTGTIYPSSYPTGDYCQCGQRKAPGDFLCDECRDELDATFAAYEEDDPCPHCGGTVGHRVNCPDGIASSKA